VWALWNLVKQSITIVRKRPNSRFNSDGLPVPARGCESTQEDEQPHSCSTFRFALPNRWDAGTVGPPEVAHTAFNPQQAQ
jgi:hypothetical protein